MQDTKMVVVVMGVSGSGKTTLGRQLADELGWPFYEGDDYHPASNIAKMARRVPLTDEDRYPWLSRLRELIESLLREGRSAVIACSALKQAYRDLLRGGDERVRFVYLRASPGLIARRLEARKGHFMPAGLLASQFETLEEPAAALVVDAARPPARNVQRVRRALDSEMEVEK